MGSVAKNFSNANQNVNILLKKWIWKCHLQNGLVSILFRPQCNKMAWQWAETLVDIRGTLADIRGTTK